MTAATRTNIQTLIDEAVKSMEGKHYSYGSSAKDIFHVYVVPVCKNGICVGGFRKTFYIQQNNEWFRVSRAKFIDTMDVFYSV